MAPGVAGPLTRVWPPLAGYGRPPGLTPPQAGSPPPCVHGAEAPEAAGPLTRVWPPNQGMAAPGQPPSHV